MYTSPVNKFHYPSYVGVFVLLFVILSLLSTSFGLLFGQMVHFGCDLLHCFALQAASAGATADVSVPVAALREGLAALPALERLYIEVQSCVVHGPVQLRETLVTELADKQLVKAVSSLVDYGSFLEREDQARISASLRHPLAGRERPHGQPLGAWASSPWRIALCD